MKSTDLSTNNYVPYSGKLAVAVVKSKEGLSFPGVRVENIAFPLTISAAQNALFCCLSEGSTPEELLTSNPDDAQIVFWEREFGIKVSSLDVKHVPDFNFAKLRLEKNIDIKAALAKLINQAIVNESNFPVAALVKTETGFFSGVNIECSSWNLGLCAERVAIAKALTHGSRLKELYVHTSKGEFSSPCGACRQVMIEHMPQQQVHLHHADHSESVHFIADLLPHSFYTSSLTKL